jgi:hypothetical protein
MKMASQLLSLQRFLFLILLTFSVSSCSKKLAAPIDKDMGLDPFGATIKVKYMQPDNKRTAVQGEILATQNDSLFVLVNRGTEVSYNVIEKIAKHNIDSYLIYYARIETTNAYMTSSLLSLLHGFFLPVSLIVNGITIAIINADQHNYYTFTSKEVEFDELYYFARFPQGIPAGINLYSIRTR